MATLKKCASCGGEKLLSAFYRDRRRPDGLFARCKECAEAARAATKAKRYAAQQRWVNENRQKMRVISNRSARRYRLRYPERVLLTSIRCRAKLLGLPFDLTEQDIVIPEVCPVLGVPLCKEKGNGFNLYLPSVDRIVPEAGYVRGNIRVISFKANSIKRDAVPEELAAVAAYARAEVDRVTAEMVLGA